VGDVEFTPDRRRWFRSLGAPHLRESKKGLNKRNGIPLFETDLRFSMPLRLKGDVIIPSPRRPSLITTYLARAA
jgi:hypothetical protein